jgi:hypothetical protein
MHRPHAEWGRVAGWHEADGCEWVASPEDAGLGKGDWPSAGERLAPRTPLHCLAPFWHVVAGELARTQVAPLLSSPARRVPDLLHHVLRARASQSPSEPWSTRHTPSWTQKLAADLA